MQVQRYLEAQRMVDRAQTFGELHAMLRNERQCANKLAEELASLYIREKEE